jgi:hypothetical protein
MNAESIKHIVESQIKDEWGATNWHSVDLRRSMVAPTRITVIERNVRNGSVVDSPMDVWLVLVEHPETGSGYRIVASSDGSHFGLATKGFPEDKHLILCGWHGDFMTTFRGM